MLDDLETLHKKRKRIEYLPEIIYLEFEIAECFRERQDTNQFYYYQECLDHLRMDYGGQIDLKVAVSKSAYCHYWLGEYEVAANWFNKSIKVNYDIPDAYYYRGYSLYHLQDYSGALDMFETYFENHDKFQKADSLMKKCEIELKH